MSQKYIDNLISAGLLVLAVLVLGVLFLSSAWAAPKQDRLFMANTPRNGVSLNKGALVWAYPTSAFERYNPPLKYLYVWPKLPTATEQLIKVAEDKLADLVVREHKAAPIKKNEALELTFDWEALAKAVGLACVCLGTFFVICLGIGGAPSKEQVEAENRLTYL